MSFYFILISLYKLLWVYIVVYFPILRGWIKINREISEYFVLLLYVHCYYSLTNSYYKIEALYFNLWKKCHCLNKQCRDRNLSHYRMMYTQRTKPLAGSFSVVISSLPNTDGASAVDKEYLCVLIHGRRTNCIDNADREFLKSCLQFAGVKEWYKT